MFDYSGAYGSPNRRRGVMQDDAAPDMGSPDFSATPPSFLSSGDGSAGSPIVVGGDPSLHMSQMTQPNQWQSFLGGMQGRGGGRGGLMGGIASLSGRGGAAGGIGRIAKFLL